MTKSILSFTMQKPLFAFKYGVFLWLFYTLINPIYADQLNSVSKELISTSSLS